MTLIDRIQQLIDNRRNHIIEKGVYYDSNKSSEGGSVPRDFYYTLIIDAKQWVDEDFSDGIWITYEDMANTICSMMTITIDYEHYPNHRELLGRPLLIHDHEIFRNKIVFYNPFTDVIAIIDDVRGYGE